ncbi:MAG: hypothetical protein KDA73_15160 [Rhodobacteraceae bacterium]|nr:hypothetical protein [Paracoccaceae bacterium]
MLKGLVVLGLIALLGGCAAPGTPSMVSRSQVGMDYIPHCQNVSPTAQSPLPFTTEYYLTTSGSAVNEGAMAGTREGLAEAGGVGLLALARMRPPSRVGSADLVARGTPPEPFCMLIDAPSGRVSAALSKVMASLRQYGYRAQRVAADPAVFETDFVFRSHLAARWTDRFIVVAEPWGDGKTALFVQRDIFISRDGSPYLQGSSVGANETWILAATRDTARGK